MQDAFPSFVEPTFATAILQRAISWPLVLRERIIQVMAALIQGRRVNGFHGTNIDRAKLILRHGFLLSQNGDDWLGDGVYFWEETPRRAQWWARQIHGEETAVIGSRLLLYHCMDLSEHNWQGFLTDIYQAFADGRRHSGRPLPSQRPTIGPHPMDCVIVNQAIAELRARGVAIFAVRSAFRSGRELWPQSAFHHHDHVQIAIRNPSLILSRQYVM